MNRLTSRLSTVIVGLSVVTMAGAALGGSGPSVRTQSIVTLGMSHAGTTTGAGGVATMIHNPATLSNTAGRSAESSMAVVISAGEYEDISASNLFNAPITGGSGSGDGVPGLLPSLYLADDIAGGVRAGLAVTSLYGLGSYYTSDWSGRYQAIDSELISLVAQPTLSWQASPWLAVGAGVQVQYMRVNTTAAIDFGAIDVALAGGAFGGVPGEDDGRLKATLDGFSAGFSVGMLVSPAPGTRIGAGYRAPITQSLDGDAVFGLGGAVGEGLSALTGAFNPTGASSDVRLPASLYLGAQQRIGSDVTVYADLNWMGWSEIGELAIDFDNPVQASAITPLPWDNSIFLAVGASWDVDDRLTLRTGAAFDQGPARNGGAAVVIPDGDSIYAATGLSYRVWDRFTLDAALGAVFTEDVDVVAGSTDPDAIFRGDFSGRFDDGRAYFGGLGLRIDL